MGAPGSGSVGEGEVQTEALSEEVTSQGCRVPSRAVAMIRGSESTKPQRPSLASPKRDLSNPLLWPYLTYELSFGVSLQGQTSSSGAGGH